MRTNFLRLDPAFPVWGAYSPRKSPARGFINCVCFALVACCCCEPLAAIAARPGDVQHVVIFWLKRPQNATDRAAVESILKPLVKRYIVFNSVAG